MEMVGRRHFVARHTRIRSRPDLFRHVARYTPHGAEVDYFAQYSDISLSGTCLISREPTRVEIGNRVMVAISLPGHDKEVMRAASVVRIASDFEFAVRFDDLEYGDKDERKKYRNEFDSLLERYAHYIQKSQLRQLAEKAYEAVQEYQKGFMIALAGAAIGVLVGAAIYVKSDDYLGLNQWWGNPHPKEWKMENVKKALE